MPPVDLPTFGSVLLAAALAAAGYAFGTAVAAALAGDRQRLEAARWGTHLTSALVLAATALLAFAFLTHDFRIRYVARYSDRSMSLGYLISSLWGGQDGSLLWWSTLLAAWSSGAVRWMRGRYLELQPTVLATLASVQAFFLVTMLFAANPFATYFGAAPADGEGLNPLLQTYWMAIHPPALYMGFVGWSVPFAFAVAALVTGRLDDEWIVAIRRWMLAAWGFLSMGLLLGMVWSYEELGWGGYWAWDPVENASFMPWLVGTAFLHSVMIQERTGMLKVWNMFLVLLTFVMTIFGTFLTRSGLIASVHSFARSDIGIYFAVYLVLLVVVCAGLLAWRLPALRSEQRIESPISREFAFLVNNWILLGMMLFVLVATTAPLLSEWLRGETITVGPAFYNRWMLPFGLVLLLLSGIGPLIAWRKATGRQLRRAFFWPVAVGLATTVLHATLGERVGFPAFVEADALYDTAAGRILAGLQGSAPLLFVGSSAFVMAAIVQEFVRGAAARRRAHGESWPLALYRLTARARRRYGGYLVHAGIVLMYVGFTGAAWDVEHETTLRVGQVAEVARPGTDLWTRKLRYLGPRMESDESKQMLFADMTVMDAEGRKLGEVHPAKFIYRSHPQMPTTEVAIRSHSLFDLYVILSTADPQTKRGTFRILLRPFVAWIWAGGLLLLLGTVVAAWPKTSELLARSRRRAAAAAAAVLLGLSLGAGPVASAQAEQATSSSLHAGSVEIRNPTERRLFERLLCMCGDCARLPLDTCGCGWAQDARAEIRARLARGEDPAVIVKDYGARYGASALAIPPDEGMDRAWWAVPVTLVLLAAGGLVLLGRRWRAQAAGAAKGEAAEALDERSSEQRASLDARLEEELRRLEEAP